MKRSQRRLARPSVGGMLATRQGSLTLALLCALAAAAVLMFALGHYKSNLNTVPQQATALVATGVIHKGTTGEQVAADKLYKSTPVAANQLAVGAIGNASSLSGEIARVDILPGQQLTSADFTASVGVTGLLGPNQRAISISIDEAHGNTDVLQAGDRVDVYATFQVAGKDASASGRMVLLVPDALVLKPAGVVATAGGRAIAGASLVLAVSSTQAPQVAYASDNGKLFLALRPFDAATTPAGQITQDTILGAQPTNPVPAPITTPTESR